MDYDFSKPQRQSVAGILIMAANTLQHIVRAMILPTVILVVKAEKSILLYMGLGTVTIVLIALIYAYFNYKKFTFFLDEANQVFIINKGVFNKTLLTIQLDKIQQVNINQSLLQKIIGVFSLQIDTPGSDSKEVSIKAIDEQVAYNLKERLLNGHKTVLNVTDTEDVVQEETKGPFLKISNSTLFKVGLTSNYGSSLALLTGFAYALFHNAKELLKAFATDDGQVEAAIKSGVSLFSVGILIALLLFVLLALNIVRTFVKYYDFEISQHKRSLLISSGLFAKKNTLVSPQKVQITTYSQNYFQKKLNMLNLNLKQAHDGEAENENERQKSNLQVPGCNPAERDELLKMILGNAAIKGTTFVPNFRFLNLPIFFTVVLPAIIYGICWRYIEQVKPFYPLAIAYVILVTVMIYISYRRHRLMVNQELIIKKSGIWDISHEIIFPHKIQSITTFQYPWHKGVDVGHVDLHTAAGIIHFKYGNYTEIKQLVNYWLYQIESGSEEWM